MTKVSARGVMAQGLIKEIQDNYDWMLANFGNYTISDMIERSTPDCITTPPVKYRQYGLQGLFDITHNLVNRYVEEGCANMVHDELEYGGTYMRPWLAMVTRFVDKEGGTVYNVRMFVIFKRVEAKLRFHISYFRYVHPNADFNHLHYLPEGCLF